jgi:hypothetical protein
VPDREGAILRQHPMTGRVYCITRWRDLDEQSIVALERVDVTRELAELLAVLDERRLYQAAQVEEPTRIRVGFKRERESIRG